MLLRLSPRAITQARARRTATFAPRERVAVALSSTGFFVAAVAVAVFLPDDRTGSPIAAASFVLAFALCSRIEFEAWSGAAVPTQLVLVPMLFAVPLSWVPFLVAAGYALGELPYVMQRQVAPARLALAGCNAWHALGPVLVLSAAGIDRPSFSDWPIFLVALAAQFALDLSSNAAYELVAFGGGIGEMLPSLGVVYLVDLTLSPLALLTAFPIARWPEAILLVVPMAALLAFFAGEHRARIDSAVELALAQSEALSLASQRDEVEQRLSQVESAYRVLVERLPLATYVVDVASPPSLRFISPQIEAMLGYPLDSFRHSRSLWTDIVHPDDRDAVESARAEWAAGKETFRAEYRALSSDGEVVWLLDQTTGGEERSDGTRSALGFLLDITERKRLEDQLTQAQRMEAVGRLAGGIAHDFNNLLTVIIGATEFMLDALPPDHPCRREAIDVGGAAERAARLVGQLLAFSRNQVLAPALLDVNDVVCDMEDLLRRLLGGTVDVALDLDSRLQPVWVDRSQLEQVILNLAVNGRDAMPAGGRLSIATSTCVVRPGKEAPGAPTPGRYTTLSVSDTGEGMDEETAARVFEPFFTTKGAGNGTGLGLATSHGIVTQSGGWMTVTSASGLGTTFTLFLPSASADVEQGEVMSVAPANDGARVILVVEDEELVRRTVERMLQQLGDVVLSAASGPDALEIAEAHPGRIDLVLTDVVMPEMSGSALGRRLGEIRPETPVLYMSGYTDVQSRELDELQASVFIQKPFTQSALGERIAQVLADAAAAERRPLLASARA